MTPEDSQTEAKKVALAPFDLLEGTSESVRRRTISPAFIQIQLSALSERQLI
jgi:hypothetical protein